MDSPAVQFVGDEHGSFLPGIPARPLTHAEIAASMVGYAAVLGITLADDAAAALSLVVEALVRTGLYTLPPTEPQSASKPGPQTAKRKTDQ